MQRIQAKNGIAMTVAACLWLGLFPLLQRFSYARITLDKWLFMLALCGVTLLCCFIDIICRFTAARNTRRSPASVGRSQLSAESV